MSTIFHALTILFIMFLYHFRYMMIKMVVDLAFMLIVIYFLNELRKFCKIIKQLASIKRIAKTYYYIEKQISVTEDDQYREELLYWRDMFKTATPIMENTSSEELKLYLLQLLNIIEKEFKKSERKRKKKGRK